MARSYGSAASLLALKEVTYGVKPTGNWEKFAFVFEVPKICAERGIKVSYMCAY